MEPEPDQPPLIVIVGETASGKSALALEMAQRFGGEIIAADSRTVYRGMDIGTAKPTAEEQRIVPHHLLDVVTPGQAFNAADFKRFAQGAIGTVAGRGRLPFLVGGSGLYVDAVLYDFSFRGGALGNERKELQELTVEQLQQALLDRGILLPENSRNPRHLVRALETGGKRGGRGELRPNTLVLGLQIDREELRRNISRRVDDMVERGFVEEVKAVAKTYGWDAPALQAPGYRAFRAYINGEIPLGEAKALFAQYDMRLAKRQRTWFRRSRDIHWLCKKEEAVDLITTFLNKGSIAKQ